MTLEEALRLCEGDKIASPLDSPPYRIRKIEAVWVNVERTDVRVSVLNYSGGAWFSPFAWVVVPSKSRYDEKGRCWVRRATKRERRRGASDWIMVGSPLPGMRSPSSKADTSWSA